MSIKNAFNRVFMKKLILIRHAKSSWKYDVIDHQRPLNNRGETDVELVSNHLADSLSAPDLVMASDAVRTRSTASVFIKNLNIKKDIVQFSYDLYDFSGENLVKTIKRCNDDVSTLMLFGHNHAITSFANAYGDRYIENVPTCGVVVIEFNIDAWEDLNQGKTLRTVFPKDLKH